MGLTGRALELDANKRLSEEEAKIFRLQQPALPGNDVPDVGNLPDPAAVGSILVIAIVAAPRYGIIAGGGPGSPERRFAGWKCLDFALCSPGYGRGRSIDAGI